jgi:hypothetical protein
MSRLHVLVVQSSKDCNWLLDDDDEEEGEEEEEEEEEVLGIVVVSDFCFCFLLLGFWAFLHCIPLVVGTPLLSPHPLITFLHLISVYRIEHRDCTRIDRYRAHAQMGSIRTLLIQIPHIDSYVEHMGESRIMDGSCPLSSASSSFFVKQQCKGISHRTPLVPSELNTT